MDQYQSPIEQVACVDQTSPPIVQTEHMSGPTLVPEIIRMIIELLLNPRSRQSIAPLRLVSKLFNALVTPLLYRYGGLDTRALMLLVSSSANLVPHEARIARDMRRYTRDVNLIAELDKTTLQMENTLRFRPTAWMANTAEIDYMAILGGFHNLRYLTIWMQPRTALTVISRDAMRKDTYTAANTWLICLVERKEGVRFENIWLRLEIDYNHRGDRNTGSALISYRYDGTLPIQEHIHRLA